MARHHYNTRHANRHETSTTVSAVTRGTTRRRRPRRRRGPRLVTRSILERYVAAMPRVRPWGMPELFDHVPQLAPQAGALTHVIDGYVVQESNEPFPIVVERSSPECGQATPHVRPGLVVPNFRPPSDSTNDAPAAVDHVPNRDAAAALAAAGGGSESAFIVELPEDNANGNASGAIGWGWQDIPVSSWFLYPQWYDMPDVQ